MSTLLFCTAYAPTRHMWQARYRRWLDQILASGFGAQQIIIVDDGSPVLPDWPDVQIVAIDGDGRVGNSDAPVVLAHFPDRLGKGAAHVFPGWFRSLGFVARYAHTRGYDQIVHIESDAVVLTERMRDWLRRPDRGWHAVWCPRYSMPELAIMKIGGDQIASLIHFTQQPYANLVGRVHETLVPLTLVNKDFRGDRFGEMAAFIPYDADFATQVPPQREANYYWWSFPHHAAAAAVQSWTFDARGTGISLLQSGWSRGETVAALAGAWSSLRLPGHNFGLRREGLSLVMDVRAPAGICQTAVVTLNGTFLARFDIDANATVGADIPPDMLRRDGSDVLTFVRTDDAGRPLADDANAEKLGIKRLTLFSREKT